CSRPRSGLLFDVLAPTTPVDAAVDVVAGVEVALCGAGAAADLPPSSTVRTTWPTLTLSPALTLTAVTRPATEDGTSMVALSVSSSRTVWSLVRVSPGLTRTRSTSPAVTFSPSSGSLKSVTKSLSTQRTRWTQRTK